MKLFPLNRIALGLLLLGSLLCLGLAGYAHQKASAAQHQLATVTTQTQVLHTEALAFKSQQTDWLAKIDQGLFTPASSIELRAWLNAFEPMATQQNRLSGLKLRLRDEKPNESWLTMDISSRQVTSALLTLKQLIDGAPALLQLTHCEMTFKAPLIHHHCRLRWSRFQQPTDSKTMENIPATLPPPILSSSQFLTSHRQPDTALLHLFPLPAEHTDKSPAVSVIAKTTEPSSFGWIERSDGMVLRWGNNDASHVSKP